MASNDLLYKGYLLFNAVTEIFAAG